MDKTKFRAVSNLNRAGRDPSLNRVNSGGGGSHGEVEYFDSIGAAVKWLLKGGGGGIVYVDADDTVAGVVKPGEREFRAVTTDSREAYFATARAAKDWLHGQRSSGWIDQYDAVIEKYMPISKETA
jgi:hypothetical protein